MQRKTITIQNLKLGPNSPVSMQSMTNTKTEDYVSTLTQTKSLINAGAEIVRISVPNDESVTTIAKIQREVNVPLCADIHFDYKLAIKCIEHGIPKIRINPGNIGKKDNYVSVLNAAKQHKTVIRIGVNIGSIPMKYQKLSPIDAMIESMKEYVTIAENNAFDNLVLSAKSSDVRETYEANKLLHSTFPYPLHIGVTEAGVYEQAITKSYTCLGALLLEGIGNTIRISIAGDPLCELYAAKELLYALKLRKGPEVIVCPTCSRTHVSDLESVGKRVKEILIKYNKNISVAVMGCNVNGPGESKKADLGITFGPKNTLIFKDEAIIKTVANNEALNELEQEIINYSE